MSCVSVGIVLQLELSEEGYHKLVIRTHTPFDFQFLRFYIWSKKRLNIGDERVKVGEYIKFGYEKGKFLKLKFMERVTLDVCEVCGAFYEGGHIDIPCKQCSDLSENNKKYELIMN